MFDRRSIIVGGATLVAGCATPVRPGTAGASLAVHGEGFADDVTVAHEGTDVDTPLVMIRRVTPDGHAQLARIPRFVNA